MKLKGKRILVVMSDFPYPPDHGGRVDMWERVKSLSKLGFIIDVIVTANMQPSEEYITEVKKYVNNLQICLRSRSLKQIFSKYPFQVNSRESLKYVALNNIYDVVLLEGEYVYNILENPHLKADFVILRVHNNEYKYFLELAASVGLGIKKIYYFTEAYKFRYLQSKVYTKVDSMLFISQYEWNLFKKKFPDIKSIFFPAAIEDSQRNPTISMSKKVLFVGSLFMDNNIEALEWYIKHVHVRLLDIAGYELIIAGNTRGESTDWIYQLAKGKQVRVYDSPQTLDNLYQESNLFINPMLHGAGVKIKTLNAIQNGLPVVATSVGNEGTGLTPSIDILVSDDPVIFADYIRQLLGDPDMRYQLITHAQRHLLENYNQTNNFKKFFLTIFN